MATNNEKLLEELFAQIASYVALAGAQGVILRETVSPAQTGDTCQDLTLKCVQFSLPEALDAGGQAGSICNERQFGARVIANCVDTDFACCEAQVQLA